MSFGIIIKKHVPEGLPFPVAVFYSFIAKISPYLKDVYKKVAFEVCNKMRRGKKVKILDVGTGPGYLPIKIANSLNACIAGIDVSPSIIKIAKRNAGRAKVKVDFRVEDANNMSFDNNTFDLILSTLSLHHWHNPAKIFNEIYRVLKFGGEAWIYDFRKDTPAVEIGRLRKVYGYFNSIILFYVTRLHSITHEETYKILSTQKKFKKYKVEERLFPARMLKIILKK